MNSKRFEIRHLTKEDISIFTSLIDVFNNVFEEEDPSTGSEANLMRLLSNPHFIGIAVLFENEVIGGLTAYNLPMYYSDSSEIFLYDLAVRQDYQRMGIGKEMIRHLKEYCSEHGIGAFFVMAHEEDEHAVEFYRATGGKSERVINFLYEVDETKVSGKIF